MHCSALDSGQLPFHGGRTIQRRISRLTTSAGLLSSAKSFAVVRIQLETNLSTNRFKNTQLVLSDVLGG